MAPRSDADPMPTNVFLSHWKRFSSSSETTSFLAAALRRRDTHSARAIQFPARPFTHLGVWAYLAFAFIVLGVTLTLAYLLYSCCHSAKGRPVVARESKALGTDRLGVGGWVDLPSASRMKVKRTESEFGSGKTVVGSGGGARSEKARSGRRKVVNGVRGVEMKGFGVRVSFGHRRQESESNREMIQMSQPNVSQISLTAAGDSFELEYPSLAALPLAHTTDRAAPYIPFHLPPPPPSPTPAHKQHVERYCGGVQRSPVSPSPSYMADNTSPPPLESTLTSAGNSRGSPCAHSTPWRDNGHGPPVEFDSHNIRFAPPLNPFMTPSAAMLWNDPKLSPINGSLITSASTSRSGTPTASLGSSGPSTPPGCPSPLATVHQGGVTIAPVPREKKRGRVIAPSPQGSAHSERVAITCPPAIRPSPGHF